MAAAEDATPVKRRQSCSWVLWEPDGRPWCEHGRAVKQGAAWRCPNSKYAADRRYERTDRGREAVSRKNATDSQKSSKALYELTRIRACDIRLGR